VSLPPPAVPAPPGAPVELDSRGYPWDGRIHAANRAKKIDGAWKTKRGVDPNLIVQCEAQNKPGNVPAIAPTAVQTAITVSPAAPPPPPVPSVAGLSVPQPPGIASTAPAGAIDFRGLMQKIQQATAAGKLNDEQVNAAMATVGLQPAEMAALIGNAPLIASVNAAIDKCLTP
jgi:hypothetical protein